MSGDTFNPQAAYDGLVAETIRVLSTSPPGYPEEATKDLIGRTILELHSRRHWSSMLRYDLNVDMEPSLKTLGEFFDAWCYAGSNDSSPKEFDTANRTHLALWLTVLELHHAFDILAAKEDIRRATKILDALYAIKSKETP